MLYFRDHRWLPVGGQSRFNAHIGTEDRTRDDVHWSLDLHYVAGGAAWRRVESYDRPSLWIGLSCFQPGVKHWTDLERVSFWELHTAEEDDWEEGPAGGVEVQYYKKSPSKGNEQVPVNDHIWRVAGREGGWFTVEFAGFVDAGEVRKNLLEREVWVTPEGKEERREPDAEFWKSQSELYLVENVPFGMVTVQVPRNVGDPEAYALRRARELVGVDAPEHIDVADFHKRDPECGDSIRGDVYVDLHFNGFFEY